MDQGIFSLLSGELNCDGLFQPDSAELVGNMSNKPFQVFGPLPFLFCQVLEVTNSRSARVQGCSRNGWCVSMPFGATFIVINLVVYSERVGLSDCVCVCQGFEHKLGYNICSCKHANGGFEGKCTLLACNHPTLSEGVGGLLISLICKVFPPP